MADTKHEATTDVQRRDVTAPPGGRARRGRRGRLTHCCVKTCSRPTSPPEEIERKVDERLSLRRRRSTAIRGAGAASPTSTTRSRSPSSWLRTFALRRRHVMCAGLAARHRRGHRTRRSRRPLASCSASQVAELVDGVHEAHVNIAVDSLSDAKQALNLRKMFLAMSQATSGSSSSSSPTDSTTCAPSWPSRRTGASSRPTRRWTIYAPLANRLGISSIKWELEDLSFFYLEPAKYQRKSPGWSPESREERERYTRPGHRDPAPTELRPGQSSRAIANRRPPEAPLDSIYMKMKNKGKELSATSTTSSPCASSLDTVPRLLRRARRRARALARRCRAASRTTSPRPSPMCYQSLHTTVVGPDAPPASRFRFAPREMHEPGRIRYCRPLALQAALATPQGNMEPATTRASTSRSLGSGRTSRLDGQQDDMVRPARVPRRDLRVDLFGDEIFVFTPKGEVHESCARALRRLTSPISRAHRGGQPLRGRQGERQRGLAHHAACHG